MRDSGDRIACRYYQEGVHKLPRPMTTGRIPVRAGVYEKPPAYMTDNMSVHITMCIYAEHMEYTNTDSGGRSPAYEVQRLVFA